MARIKKEGFPVQRDDKGRVFLEPTPEAVAQFEKEEKARQDALRDDLNARYAALKTDEQRKAFRDILDYHPGPGATHKKAKSPKEKESAAAAVVPENPLPASPIE